MLKNMLGVLVGFAFIAAAASALVHWLDRPEVHKSWATQQCIDVKDPAAAAAGRKTEWSCDNLPPRYELIWVK